ncbi:hypothetical protein LCGC14_2366360 [marine sediment metagenome]|uniref:Uncharacterized protein n=1 Tax=marine sediment metagenome TaxID=412755 RepID=A0A0F9EHK9_9ZZZZ
MSKSIQCPNCKNFNVSERKITCKAFKKGIPSAIIAGRFDHTQQFEGDNGIRFDPREKIEIDEEIEQE